MRLPENGAYGSQNIVKSAQEYQERKQSQGALYNLFLPDYFYATERGFSESQCRRQGLGRSKP
jgi:hypothetical protein